MASLDVGTSSGSEYQVFLSFRGPDTRIGFTDVLFHSLTNAGICVFRDDEELRVGERINGSLQQAINNSRIYIPVFSRTYASSQWCLHELTQIVANTFKSKGYKEILPIFFDVDPDDVKLKTPLYRDAIINLEREKNLRNEQVNAWREALKEVDAIKGWEVKKYTGHGELVNLVVEEVVKKLKTNHISVTKHLVGIDDRVKAVSELLEVDSGGVRLIQIHGMGGIGKTTVAQVVFNQLSSHYGKCCCFLQDVRAKASRTDGLVELQKNLLSEIGIHAATRSIDKIDYGMKRIGEALHNKEVFIVLDDVDNSEQVEKLVGKTTLYPGSRILITTRNKDVMRIYRPNCQIIEYEMEVMSTDHALQLFSKHAFARDSPSNDYSDLSREIISITGRLPLALEVIGSFLYHKTPEQWKNTLTELRKKPHDDVFGKLKISYDALSYEQQQIFLDVACFFIGEDKMNAMYMWEDCDFFPNNGVNVLISMSLVKIVQNNVFWMHDQLRDLGRDIVRQENQMNPGERSRIWIREEVLDAIRTTEMKNKVQALDLDLKGSDLNTTITSEEIGRFEHLRYLKLRGVTLVGNLTNRLTNLRWIIWDCPPNKFFQLNHMLHLKNAVVLQILDDYFICHWQLQSLIKMASKLKVLSLDYCYRITRTPNFSGCPNLERFTFTSALRKIDGSIWKLKWLIDLKIMECNFIKDLPEEIGDLVNLKYFFVDDCGVTELPDSIWKLKSLCELHFSCKHNWIDTTNSWELPSAIGMLRNLETLLVNSWNVKGQLPSEIGHLPSLRILNLSCTHLSEVPETLSMLTHLQRLELMECDEIQELPALPTSLTHLKVSSRSLRVVPDLSNLTNLVNLVLGDIGEGGDKLCTGEFWWIGRLSKLTELRLGLHNVPAPTELASLSQLNQLDLFHLDLQTFPQLPLSLQKLRLDSFDSTVSLSPNLRNLSRLELYWCFMKEIQLDGLQLPHIRELLVESCLYLERFRLSSMTQLKHIKVSWCPNLVEIQFPWAFESLEVLSIEKCASLRGLVYVGEAGHDNNESASELINCEGRLIIPSRALNKLRSFELEGCYKIREIQVVGTFELWELFTVCYCRNVQSLGGLSNSKNLKYLNIYENNKLRVVEGLDELEFLQSLLIRECRSLKRLINVSKTKLPDDCDIEIWYKNSRKDFGGSLESYKHYKGSRFHWNCTCFASQ